MVKKIENLATNWERAADTLQGSGSFAISQVEGLLRETYALCSAYGAAGAVPKAFCKVFVQIHRFLDFLAAACHLDALTTPSDAAEFTAIGHILDEIQWGFYEGAYECVYPQISVDGQTLNVEAPFLEAFIDQNR